LKQDDDQAYEKVGEFVSIFNRRGVWYVNYQHENRQIRRSLKTRNKKEARRRALIIEKELLAGDHKHQRRAPLIKDVVEEYIAHLRAEGRSEKTVCKYQFCFDLLLEIAGGHNIKRLSQLDVSLVDRYRSERTTGGPRRMPAKPKTVHNDTVTIRQLINFALKRGLIAEDPLKNLEIKKPKRTPQPCWTREQVDQILNEAKPPHREPLVLLAETGTRIGEGKWLTWDDVDLDRRLIHIRPKDGWKPKSGDERVVPMSERLYEMLKTMPKNGGWVFTSRVTRQHPEAGRQISERRLLQYLKRVLKRLGLVGHLHTFRHSFISFAACEGVPERVLRKWIGHVDREILDWYFHLADPQSQEAMKRLSDASKQKSTDSERETDSNSAQSQHKPKGEKNDESAM
jgi:integrase/recombinase XerD